MKTSLYNYAKRQTLLKPFLLQTLYKKKTNYEHFNTTTFKEENEFSKSRCMKLHRKHFIIVGMTTI